MDDTEFTDTFSLDGPQTSTIALVGPSGSGKTLAALALGAARLPLGDSPALRMRVTPRFDAENVALAADIPSTAIMLQPSADAAVRYEFDVELPGPRESLVRTVQRWARGIRPDALTSIFEPPPPIPDLNVCVQVVDGPGGVFFPASDERGRAFQCGPKLRTLVQSAQTLVLCVNAAEPAGDAIGKNIPGFIAQMTQGDGYLPYRAVLVLMTQVDRVADRAIASLREWPDDTSPILHFFQHHPAATAVNVCRHMHARELARSVIGDMALYQLWSHLRRGSRFGVGVASSTGLAGADTSWTSVGLDDALYFGLNGDAARDRRLGAIMEYVVDTRPGPPPEHVSEIRFEVPA